LSFLVTAAVIAFEFVVTTQGLCIGEASEAVCDRSILIYVNLQIEEILVFARNSLTVKAACFRRQISRVPMWVLVVNLQHPLPHIFLQSVCSEFSPLMRKITTVNIVLRSSFKSNKQILTQNNFIYVIYKEVQKLMRILLHIIIKFL